MTADEVTALEREKQGQNGADGGPPADGGVREIEKPNNATRTPNNKGPQARNGVGAPGNPPSGGSLKRKAGQAGLSSPMKKVKQVGGGRIHRLPSESEDEIGLGED